MKIQFKNRGFTVLEAIVAIAVLSLSISGVFSAVQQALSQSTLAKEQVTAFYLAQEATEMIRNIRDSNQLTNINGSGGATWLDRITSACPFSTAGTKNTCTVDATNFQIANCAGGGHDWGSCPVLNQDPNTFLYGYAAGTATPFRREIQIEQITSDEISVTVQVSWSKGPINQSVKVKTFLFNWI